ncbi:extracellular solute-binding protein [Paenibacillus periandrae]|uniref:extracellular solute-binding protein n=1 Tax=Paenibacillus periandrae TaxID=1761741 RepID=UPI001F09FAAD|nr:extracellular solute-binding protein [Paenibacillus periandrae]
MNTKRLTQAASAAMTLLLAAGTVACSSPEQTTPVAAAEKPTEIRILTTTYAESPGNELESLKRLNEKFNVKLSVQYEPINNYQDKLNALLASNELPDVTLVWSTTVASYTTAIKQGAFWDLTPYIPQYPNLAKLPEQVYKNLLVSGKTVGIPRVRPLDGHEALIIRKDWLNQLGLPLPKTSEELYKVMEAFTNSDPDGNGKPDTYGMATGLGPSFQSYLTSMFGTRTNWSADGAGGIQPAWWTLAYKQALEYWNRAYKDKLVTPDLAIVKYAQIKDQMLKGKAGLTISNISDAAIWNQDLKKTNPQAQLIAVELPAAPDGKTYYEQAVGSFGLFMVNKKVSEDKLKKILEVYDYASTTEGYNLVTYGIKDTDYSIGADGAIVQTEDGKKKGYSQSTTGQWIAGVFDPYLRASYPGISAEEKAANYKLVDTIGAQSLPDPGTGLDSPTWAQKGADWKKKIDDTVINTVIGKTPVADWDRFVQSFKEDASFQKYVAEINEAYKEKNRKP